MSVRLPIAPCLPQLAQVVSDAARLQGVSTVIEP